MKWKVVFLVFAYAGVAHAQHADLVKAHTQVLASDSLGGRGQGSEGIRKAAQYIAAQFSEIGLEQGYKGEYYQEFSIPGQSRAEVNVVGYVPATVPSSRTLVFMAHYDGYGIRSREGQQDSIYNGARDNAVGVGALIELARMYSGEAGYDHNLVFIATAGEEFGLHGSKAYLEDPLFPADQIIMCLNIDGFNVSGRREDYFMMPRQGINFGSRIEEVLAQEGWTYESPDWVDGMNTMFDTAVFLEHGIPGVTIWTGNKLIGGGQAPVLPLGDIHSPADEVNAYWDWSGVDDHLKLYKTLGDHFLRYPENLEVTDTTLFSKDLSPGK